MSAAIIMWHGAHRWEGPPEIRALRQGHAEHGPGIYMTTSVDTARKYAKGGGSLIRFEVDRDLVLLEDVRLPVSEMIAFSKIKDQSDLVRVAKMELSNLPHEEVLAIGLDGTMRIIGVVRVSQGGVGGAAMTAQEVIRPMLAMGATAFVVAHNHPSGDPTPSREDYTVTDHIKKAAECVHLSMLDHIVIGGIRGGGYTEIMNRYATGTFAKD